MITAILGTVLVVLGGLLILGAIVKFVRAVMDAGTVGLIVGGLIGGAVVVLGAAVVKLGWWLL